MARKLKVPTPKPSAPKKRITLEQRHVGVLPTNLSETFPRVLTNKDGEWAREPNLWARLWRSEPPSRMIGDDGRLCFHSEAEGR